ncbi:MAG: amino acid racemase [Woeseia sp.]
MTNNELTVGVLGGMGPEATVDFMTRVLALTSAKKDQDHIHMLVDHNPKVPNRQAAIRGTGEDAGPALAAMAQRLESAGAGFLVMPCNSAHAFLQAIRAVTGLPLVSIIRESVREIARVSSGAKEVGVMATDALLETGIYQTALLEAGLAPLLPPADELGRLMDLIGRIKAGDKGREVADEMSTLAELLASSGADVIIAACTEIPLVLHAGNISVPVISTTDVLARRTVEIARGGAMPACES